ncbi:MAG TPA: GFA family protein [Caulobacteraceae bacterium]|nr:GFA family protein [Caulobacteraceae bacterium]
MRRTGGCQCGAVRFAVEAIGRPSICHCRMCQKAFAAPYGALVSVKLEHLTWTRGEPSRFQSSNKVRRGFCSACGTPLTFEWSEKVIDLAICAFDDPREIRPVTQLARHAALPWVDETADLPDSSGAPGATADFYASIVSHQHPDHDTESWPHG